MITVAKLAMSTACAPGDEAVIDGTDVTSSS
jgi:hypothetical protein